MRERLDKVLVIGSGPIVIGQAAEFDYSGSQACKALKEEGIKVVVVNSNPATIQTDRLTADKIYLEPLLPEVLEAIIEKERPDGIIATMGGQTGLNLAYALHEKKILERYSTKLLGTDINAIIAGEDRDVFKRTMKELNLSIPPSKAITNIPDALDFANEIGYPVIVRPAYTLGGTGGGIAKNKSELEKICDIALTMSPVSQALIEKDVSKIAELEYEMIRDSNGNAICICNMENIDPMGIHTGESIVVAPCQTLSNEEINFFRDISIKIVDKIGIKGGCNIQYALDQRSGDYYVIEINPRLSRSSALASKATGYPIARVATKIAIGYHLYEIENKITGTSAAFEPSLDYCVVKIPKWPFYKMPKAERTIGTQMKSTGEVMAIGRTFEEALMKALYSLEMKWPKLDKNELYYHMEKPTDLRIFAIFEALRLNMSINEIHKITGIHEWFLHRIRNIILTEYELKHNKLNENLLFKAKRLGLSDNQIGLLTGIGEDYVYQMRKKAGINATYKMVDTCAGEFKAITPYYYSTFESTDDSIQNNSIEEKGIVTRKEELKEKKKILIIGSGPIRIGQGIEFDYCCVHSAKAVKEENMISVLINCNPETVSTDFDTSDMLFFEPLTYEKVVDLIETQKIDGIIVQFGGQTPLDLALLLKNKYEDKILGTSINSIEYAGNREKFREFLKSMNIKQPDNGIAYDTESALEIAKKIGFPIVVRPSFVIAGRAMDIIFTENELRDYLIAEGDYINKDNPLLIDKYIDGIECETDTICDGKDVFIGGIMEHVEKAGVHSGDAYCVVPPISLSEKIQRRLIEYTKKIALGLKVIGLINIQFIVKDDEIYVLEANTRASRTIPYLSKAINVPMAKIATHIMLGKKLKDFGLQEIAKINHYAVKGVVFPFIKLKGTDVILGPEMKSTGETIGIAKDFDIAFLKAVLAANTKLIEPIKKLQSGKKINIAISLSDKEKHHLPNLLELISDLNVNLYMTLGTYEYSEKIVKNLSNKSIDLFKVNKVSEDSMNNIISLIRNGTIDIVINSPNKGNDQFTDGYKIRRASIEKNVPCLTRIETSLALLKSLKKLSKDIKSISVNELSEFFETK
ncbi:MAG: carbamoyl-phosphate synthase large subunit [Candidatus Micrarchaeota archaeon]|nr:carbamoyl-phosphate synthase large subunit [Candidatus Micrarchaeota archaeon]